MENSETFLTAWPEGGSERRSEEGVVHVDGDAADLRLFVEVVVSSRAAVDRGELQRGDTRPWCRATDKR
jgi:hypothetical protein